MTAQYTARRPLCLLDCQVANSILVFQAYLHVAVWTCVTCFVALQDPSRA